MLRLFGPVQQLFAASEPCYTGELAADTQTNYCRNVHCGPIGQAALHTNLAIFILLFTVCAIEVLVVKIVTTIRDGIDSTNINTNDIGNDISSSSSSSSSSTLNPNSLRISVSRIAQLFSFNDQNNNNQNVSQFSGSVHREAWNWIMALQQAIQQPQQQQDSLPQRLIPTHTFLERIAQATEGPFPDDNNNYQ